MPRSAAAVLIASLAAMTACSHEVGTVLELRADAATDIEAARAACRAAGGRGLRKVKGSDPSPSFICRLAPAPATPPVIAGLSPEPLEVILGDGAIAADARFMARNEYLPLPDKVAPAREHRLMVARERAKRDIGGGRVTSRPDSSFFVWELDLVSLAAGAALERKPGAAELKPLYSQMTPMLREFRTAMYVLE